jgi:hypothetical protein
MPQQSFKKGYHDGWSSIRGNEPAPPGTMTAPTSHPNSSATAAAAAAMSTKLDARITALYLRNHGSRPSSAAPVRPTRK